MTKFEEGKESPIDPLSDLDLDLKSLKSNTKTPTHTYQPDTPDIENIVNNLSADTQFKSRAPVKIKPKTISKSVSLFPEEVNFLSTCVYEFSQSSISRGRRASDSDVIRAALKVFDTLSQRERTQIISENRARDK